MSADTVQNNPIEPADASPVQAEPVLIHDGDKVAVEIAGGSHYFFGQVIAIDEPSRSCTVRFEEIEWRAWGVAAMRVFFGVVEPYSDNLRMRRDKDMMWGDTGSAGTSPAKTTPPT